MNQILILMNPREKKMKLENLLIEEAKQAIKETLDVSEDKKLNEAFAAQPKQFSLKTDFLSDENIKNHIEPY